MYGLLLDAIQKFLREKYGEAYWTNIRRRAKLQNHWFVTHEVYPDSVMVNLVDAAAEELGMERDSVMMMFGEYFAENIGRYGYARLLRVLGRDLRDFLNGLDDLHEYLRFSYPKMSPPSFVCADETPEGMFLHYTTKRKGFLCYVIGQLKTVGKIYGKELEISVDSEETDGVETHFVLNLKFDNREMLMPRRPSVMGFADFQIDSDTFFNIFPFGLVFSEDLIIRKVGSKLQEVLPDLFGQQLDHAFTLRKPQFGRLNWNQILMRANCTYELLSVKAVHRSQEDKAMEYSSPAPQLKLKGQMMLLGDINYIAFLCSPAMDSPEELYESGIFINDLSMHDSSRDFILAGSQQNPELNIALSQERIRSAQLEESVKKTDELLYQMIPKPIADKLRNGEPPLNTCQELDSVSILFSDIVSFTPMCSRLKPMEVVCVLNSMYVAYDKLCEKHLVYKVETIGDAYMVLAGGPIPTPNHAGCVTDFALGIVEATAKIKDPSTNQSLRIRVGIHSGPVVAGVVGSTVLRYDVFGDTVNIAARMESTGEPMKIHVSEATAELLQGQGFIVVERGKVEVKGKGLMSTYWVTGKKPSHKKEGDDNQSMLTPSQRQRRTPVVTRTSSSSSPQSSPWPKSTSTPVPPSSRARRFVGHEKFHGNRVPRHRFASSSSSAYSTGVSPAPDEWPQADRRLSDRQPSFSMRMRQRSSTLPMIEVLDPEVQAILAQRQGSLTLNLPNGILGTPLSREGSVNNDYAASRSNSIISEYNLARIRESLSQSLPTINEGGSSQLALFAAMAEENARSARRLADLAADMARSEAMGQLQGAERHREGSSVDPPPPSPAATLLPPTTITSSGTSSPCPFFPSTDHTDQHRPPNDPPLACPFSPLAHDSRNRTPRATPERSVSPPPPESDATATSQPPPPSSTTSHNRAHYCRVM